MRPSVHKLPGSLPGYGTLICGAAFAMRKTLRKYCHVNGGDTTESIGSSVSDAFIRSRLWSTATGSSHSVTSVALLKVEGQDHKQWS